MALNFNKASVTEENVNAAPVEAAAPAEAAAPVEAAAPANKPENLNSLSDKIAFVCPLTNPMRDDVVTTTLQDGTKDKVVTPFICGYRFKALVDVEIPDCGTTPEFKKNYMDYSDINGKKAVKAGEEFDVTPFEMALMASWPEVNGVFAGGEHKAVCGFSRKLLNNKSGAGAAVTISEFPRAVLKLSQGSIKDIPGVNVCEKSYNMNESGKKVKVGTLNPGFEKWAPLVAATKRSARSAGEGASAGRRSQYDAAARMFQELAKGKGYVR